MTKMHQQNRLDWAKYHMSWKLEYERIIFSDEKKFNLDGPDGFSHYWHDLRKEPETFSKCQQGGGSLMVWAAFGFQGKVNIAFPSGRMNAINYQDLLEENLLPFAEEIGGPYWMFQQDNASIHTANSTWEWFLNNGVHVIPWPSVSPDLNPMENVWSLLVREIYANGKQYATISELKASIISHWKNIAQNTLKSLVRSMPNRVFTLIRKSGAYTGY